MKPILVIFLNNATQEQLFKQGISISEHLKSEYHVLVMNGEKHDVKVFYEKDQIELDKEKLEELLALCK